MSRSGRKRKAHASNRKKQSRGCESSSCMTEQWGQIKTGKNTEIANQIYGDKETERPSDGFNTSEAVVPSKGQRQRQSTASKPYVCYCLQR